MTRLRTRCHMDASTAFRRSQQRARPARVKRSAALVSCARLTL